MSKKEKRKKKKTGFINPISKVYPRFALFISGVTIGASAITFFAGYLIVTLGILSLPSGEKMFPPLITFLAASSALAIIISCLLGSRVFKTILEVSRAMQRVAGGDFSVRVRSSVKNNEFSGALAEKAVEILKANGEDAYIIGEIVKSDEGVILC